MEYHASTTPHRIISFTNPRSDGESFLCLDIESKRIVDTQDEDLRQTYDDQQALSQFLDTVREGGNTLNQSHYGTSTRVDTNHLIRTFHWITKLNEDISHEDLEKHGSLDMFIGDCRSSLLPHPQVFPCGIKDKFTLRMTLSSQDNVNENDNSHREQQRQVGFDDPTNTDTNAHTDLIRGEPLAVTGIKSTCFPDGSFELKIGYRYGNYQQPTTDGPSQSQAQSTEAKHLMDICRNRSTDWNKNFTKVDKAFQHCLPHHPPSDQTVGLDISLGDGDRSCLITKLSLFDREDMPDDTQWVAAFYGECTE
ncbi:hypothetical protein V866_006301 [Kwoniella sp. B9012]